MHGLMWSFLERIGQQGVQLVISIILARLLLPAEFGLIAMLMLFISLAHALLDSGFGSALIRKQDASRLDESSVFYFNIVLGLAIAGLFALSAPWIAAFYKIPQLIPVIHWMSLNLIINSFGIVQTALMTKCVDFKTQMKASIIASALSGVLGVFLAYEGFGVWSLVVQSISSNTFRTILLWTLSSWRPLWGFSLKAMAEMFPYGSRLLFTSLINTVFNNIYYLIIGRLFTATDLGYYSRAQSTQQLPVQHILTSTVTRVIFPVFASLQDDLARLKKALRKSLTSMALVTFPIMIGLAIVAKPMVLVLLTEKWLPTVPYLQLLCVVGLLFPLQQVGLSNLIALGRSDLSFKIEVQTKIFILVAIAITYRWGIKPMIYGQIVTACIAYAITSIHLRLLLGYRLWEQVKDLFPSLFVSILMGVVIYLIGIIGIQSQIILLASQVTIGIVVFGALCYLFKLPSFEELLSIIKTRSGLSAVSPD